MTRLVPHPGLSALLLAAWLLAQGSLGAGSVLVGAVIAVVLPLLTAPFWPNRPAIRFGWPLAAYLGLVLWDILAANVHVARLVLLRPARDLRSAWLDVPLELTSAEAITVFAATISLTPGTVSADLSADGRHLLVHALDAPDPAAEVIRLKARYERRLLEIFR